MTTTTTRLFFTGGWDSTFRLLELLLVEKRPVQPIYVIDPDRWSLQEEQKAMADIKTTVVERFPETADLLKPTMIITTYATTSFVTPTRTDYPLASKIHPP